MEKINGSVSRIGISGAVQTVPRGKAGGYYSPTVTQISETSITFGFEASENGMPTAPAVTIELPRGAKGDKGEDGENGRDGKDGSSFTILGTYESVSALQAAESSAAQGAVYNVGSAAPYELYMMDQGEWRSLGNLKGAQGERGEKGEKGDRGEKGETGEKGEQGAEGKTPTRGEDYWTETDIAEIRTYVEEAIIGGTW